MLGEAAQPTLEYVSWVYLIVENLIVESLISMDLIMRLGHSYYKF